jgi:hypothetical protein
VCRLGGYSGTPEQDGQRARRHPRPPGQAGERRRRTGCGLTTGNRGWTTTWSTLSDPAEDARLVAEAGKLAKTPTSPCWSSARTNNSRAKPGPTITCGDRMSLDLSARRWIWRARCWPAASPTVVVLIHGSPLAIPELAQNAPAILDGFYLGEETGTAVAERALRRREPGRPPALDRATHQRRRARLLQPQAIGRAPLPVRDAWPRCGRSATGRATPPSATIRSKVQPARIAPTARPPCP